MAGGTMTPDQYDEYRSRLEEAARAAADHTVAAIGVEGAEVVIRQGDAGRELCALAEELGADAIVMGSRGRGGIRRALPLLGPDPFLVCNTDALWIAGPRPALPRLFADWDPARMDVLLLVAVVSRDVHHHP